MLQNLLKTLNDNIARESQTFEVDSCIPGTDSPVLRPGTVTLIAGTRHSGKTSYLLHLLRVNAEKGLKSVFYPFREDSQSVVHRLFSGQLNYPTNRIDDMLSQLTDEERSSLINVPMFKNISFGDGKNFSLEMVEKDLYDANSYTSFIADYNGDIRLVVIDDFHFMDFEKSQSLEVLLLRFKKLAMKLNVVIILSVLLEPKTLGNSEILSPIGYTTFFSPRLATFADNVIYVFYPERLRVYEDEKGNDLRDLLMFFYVGGSGCYGDIKQRFDSFSGHFIIDEKMQGI